MSDPPAVIPLAYADPSSARLPPVCRRTVRACQALAALCCAAAWAVLVFWESVRLAGAMLLAIGLLLVVGGALTRDWRAVAFGVAHVAACAAFVAVLRWGGWGLRETGTPFIVMVALFPASALCLAAWSPVMYRRPRRRPRGGRARHRVARA